MLKLNSRLIICSIITFLIFVPYLPQYNVSAESYTITLFASLAGNHSVSNVGDVNGDGYDDVIVGEYYSATAKKAYIYYGGKHVDNIADVILEGEDPGDNFGWSVSGAGDVNGDGYSDVIVGAHLNDRNGHDWGGAFIFYGGQNMDNISDVILVEEWGHFGYRVSNAGDLNSDGYDDVVVAAPSYSTWAFNELGKIYIYFGGDPMDSNCDLNYTGDYQDNLGSGLSHAGDVNNDGFSDIIASAPGGSIAFPQTGEVYVFYGGNPMNLSNHLVIENSSLDDNWGTISSAGDINNDGYDDILVGAPYCNDSGYGSAGAVLIYLGGDPMDNITDLILYGETEYSKFGCSLSYGGDVNNDGIDDFIVGAFGARFPGYRDGAVYIYYGNNSLDNMNYTRIINDGYSRNAFGLDVSTSGDMNKDGYDDLIIGARDYAFIFGPNMAPSLMIIEPDGISDYADYSYLITWTDEDSEDNATINFYYSTMPDLGSIAIWEAFNIAEDNETDQFLWDTSKINGGNYYIRAWIEDGINPRVWANSTGMVTINHHPIIEITVPSKNNNNADESFTIAWEDQDNEDNATISLYYDSDDTGNDGILIVEDIGEDDDLDMFTWNITEIPDDTYFIYAEIDDQINPVYSNYSTVPLIIHHKIPILNITNIECKPSSPKEGDRVEISATILNSGDRSGRNIVVELIVDNNLMDYITADEILPNNNTFKVIFNPINLEQGKHTITLRIEYENKIVMEEEELEVQKGPYETYFLILLLIIISVILIVIFLIYKKHKSNDSQEIQEISTSSSYMQISCPNCSFRFSVPSYSRPINVQCPNCGTKGALK